MTDDERIEELEAKLRALDEREAAEQRRTDRVTIESELVALGHGPATSKVIASMLSGEDSPVRREGGALVFDGAPSLRAGLAAFARAHWGEDATAPTEEPTVRGSKLLRALHAPLRPPAVNLAERGAALLAAVRGGQ